MVAFTTSRPSAALIPVQRLDHLQPAGDFPQILPTKGWTTSLTAFAAGASLNCGPFMKVTFGALLFCLLGAMVCASAALPVDDLNTPFNEADTPACLARPASARLKLAPPVVDSTILPSLSFGSASLEFNNLARGFTPLAKPGEPRSVQKLLCTFLI